MYYDVISDLFLALSIITGCLIISRYLFHLFQLESYQFAGYFRAIKRNFKNAVLPGVILALASGLVYFTAGVLHNFIPPRISGFLCLLMMPLVAVLIRRFSVITNEKKALVMTKRMIRLYCFTAFGMLLIIASIRAICYYSSLRPTVDTLFEYICPYLPLFLPLWVAFGALIAWPFEKLIASYYFHDAKRILDRNPGLIRIGVTGSWGKTSVKSILGTLLGIKYSVFVTPESINTPMGISRLIRSEFRPGYRVFVSEMGARHVGDISELCRLVKPQYGIITSVGPQHLDTFGTVDNVAKTKYELIRALPDDGCAFFADDHDICYALYKKTDKEKYLAGSDKKQDDVWAENINVTYDGSHFDLCTKNGRIECSTVLLGELNVRNITLACSAALKLGLNLEQLKTGISAIKPVPHRLQLIKQGKITLIDDAYNSNIEGAMMAFSILKKFPGRHIVVTPGMVELGSQKEILTKRFGEALALAADVVVFVGIKQTKTIMNTLILNGFRRDRIHVQPDLASATALLKETSKPGDVILFENDLPDNYTEGGIKYSKEVIYK